VNSEQRTVNRVKIVVREFFVVICYLFTVN
jgi:hypothetical protein